jgi:hypothetical protein
MDKSIKKKNTRDLREDNDQIELQLFERNEVANSSLINQIKLQPFIHIVIYHSKYLSKKCFKDISKEVSAQIVDLRNYLNILSNRMGIYVDTDMSYFNNEGEDYESYIKYRIQYLKEHSKNYPKLHAVDFDELLRHLNGITKRQLSIKEISKIMNIDYHILYRAVKDILNYRFVKCSRINDKYLSTKNFSQTVVFSKWLIHSLNNGYEMIFIDESSFNTNKRTGKRWVRPNQNVEIADKGRISGVNLILACSQNSIIHHEIDYQSLDSIGFICFLNNLFDKINENPNLKRKIKIKNYY